MRIQPVLPFSHFAYFFIAPFVFFVIVGPGGVIDVVPIRDHFWSLSVLLPLLAASTLSLFLPIEAIYIVIIGCRGPIGEGRLDMRACR